MDNWPHHNKWKDMPGVLIASGPSLDAAQFPQAQDALDIVEAAHNWRKVKVLTCNDACYLAEYTDLIYAGDRRWWQRHFEAIQGNQPRPGTDDFYKFRAECFTKDPGAVEMYRLHRVHQGKATGLEPKPGWVAHGGNSGFQMLNLAYHLGLNPIYLLGYDFKNIKEHGTHRNHFFGNHPSGWGNAQGVRNWIFTMHGMAKGLRKRGIEVVNCSIDSDISTDDFPRGWIGDYI